MVLGLVGERQNRFAEAQAEIAQKWSNEQTLSGPIAKYVTTTAGVETDNYVLPQNVKYEVQIEPEVRSRGIFKSVVYTTKIKATGEFNSADLKSSNVVVSLPISDTRGLEKQYSISWSGTEYPFEPGAAIAEEGSGIHANVPVSWNSAKIPFSFEIQLKGSKSFSVAPVGKETSISMMSPWASPKFVGNFLPSKHDITNAGFTADWQIASFGRSYPQTWQNHEVSIRQITSSAAGVELLSEIDAYDMTFRSIKYAILFIVITFAAFFLFDILAKTRVHPIQYFLIGSALALFYLILLALSEQIGFGTAYIVATILIAGMVTLYSRFVLKSSRRAMPIAALLVLLYAYLYFVLQLEDYALLFGSLILFVLLSVVMYTTRNIDWFEMGKIKEESI
jgi:inner membrane protein